MNTFEKASRVKLRFEIRGPLTVEDLWTLPLEELNAFYKKMCTELRDQEGDSLLEEPTHLMELQQLQRDIVKHIVQMRLTEQQAAENERVKAQKKQRLFQILAEKQDEKYKEMSTDELEKLIDEL